MSAHDTRQLTERFIEALHRLEKDGLAQVDGIAGLFADDAELTNPQVERRGSEARGREGARRFWTNYRAAFHEIHSAFNAVTTSGDSAGLFWRSQGTNAQGQPVVYEGATLLEFDDARRIRRFKGYFDSRSLTTPALSSAGSSEHAGYG